MSRILLLINPNSRSGISAGEQVEAALTRAGHSVLIPEKHKKDADPNEMILKHHEDVDYVMVGGGDGSVNLVLPALLECQKPLLVLPLGTANNLARTYALPSRIEEVLKLLEEGTEICADVGRVNGIYFMSVAGLGLSTEVNLNVNSTLKKYLGVLAFILTAMKMIFKMNPFRAELIADGGRPIYTKSWQISVCNGKFYGSGLTVKDDASLHDRKFHLLSTEVHYWWQSIFMAPAFMTGKYKKEHEVMLLDAKVIEIKTRRKLRIDVDGDIKTTTPAKFEIIPKALRLLVPKVEA